MFGAVQTGDVDEVNDDGDAIYSAAQRFLTAVSEAGYASSRASSSWDYLPDVLRADALTPALEPLMRPAQNLADDLLGSAEAIARAASAASDELDDLKHRRRNLIGDIEDFHASAAGKAEERIRQQAASGDILGAMATTLTSWKEVPALVGDELGLRLRVTAFNDDVAFTLSSLAARFNGIDAGSRGTDRLPDIGSPHATVTLLDEGVAPTAVAALMGESVGDLLSGMSETQIETALEKNSGLGAWLKGQSVADVSAWWRGLGEAQRRGVIAGAPGIVGALAGIPYADRSTANTTLLTSTMKALRLRGDTGSSRKPSTRMLLSAAGC